MTYTDPYNRAYFFLVNLYGDPKHTNKGSVILTKNRVIKGDNADHIALYGLMDIASLPHRGIKRDLNTLLDVLNVPKKYIK